MTKGLFLRRLLDWDLLVVVGVVLVLSALMAAVSPGFLTQFNIRSLLAFVAVTAIVGLAQMSVLAIGQFNLALPAMGAANAMLLGWMLEKGQLSLGAAVGLVLLAGVAMGLIQGLLIAKAKLNAFIVTLGYASFLTGLLFVVLGSQQFTKLGSGIVWLSRASLGPVPVIFLLAGAVAVCAWIVFNRTVVGREVLATGASSLAAAFSAVPTERRVLFAHIASGVLAACAAIILVFSLGSAQPAIGRDWLLASFAAPVLGGTLLSGGRISVAGTCLGALLLAVIANGLVIFGVSQYWYQAGLGLIVLIAVMLEVARVRLRQNSVVSHG